MTRNNKGKVGTSTYIQKFRDDIKIHTWQQYDYETKHSKICRECSFCDNGFCHSFKKWCSNIEKCEKFENADQND